MIRARVQSSNVKSVGFDPKTSTMEIEFHDGAIYQYDDVNFGEYNRLMNAGSIGSHLAKVIKPSKNARRIDGERR